MSVSDEEAHHRVLNSNTVLDSYPLPHVNDILANCVKGHIWSCLDMMNSFFHTWVHSDDIHLTAVTTPFGLYEWTVMPQGLKNVPPIHPHWMNATLCPLIGKIWHIYIDDIVIWSNTVTKHVKHINIVMKALIVARLFCNPKKCDFFLTEMDFLRHHISAWGIELNTSKIQMILDWPIPTNLTEVWAFLGLVQYIASFLPKLANHMYILTPLTNKCSKTQFFWTADHQCAFEAIKALVVRADCLTVMDHTNPGKNKIFVTHDASNWHMGACLSFGETWEMAWPVAYDLMQLGAVEKNYPIHEKELLAVVRALKKWWSDLLGLEFTVCIYWPSNTGKLWHSMWPIQMATSMAGIYVTIQNEYCLHLQGGQLHGRCPLTGPWRCLSWQMHGYLSTTHSAWCMVTAHWCHTLHYNQLIGTWIHQRWLLIWQLLCSPCPKWYPRGTADQWLVVHQGSPCDPQNRWYPWKPFSSCTWHPRAFWRW